MAKQYRTENFKGPLMRISYAYQLFTPREFKKDDGSTRKVYSCTLIAPKSADWSPITGALKECVAGQWGDRGVEKWKSGLIKNPILPGDGKEARSKETGDLHSGMGADVQFIRVQANEDRQPLVFAPDAVTRIVDADDCPSGSWGYPVLNAFCWHNDQNGDGISFGISMFQLVKKAEGDDILGGGGGRADPSKFFESVKTDDVGGAKPASAADMFG